MGVVALNKKIIYKKFLEIFQKRVGRVHIFLELSSSLLVFAKIGKVQILLVFLSGLNVSHSHSIRIGSDCCFFCSLFAVLLLVSFGVVAVVDVDDDDRVRMATFFLRFGVSTLRTGALV